MRAIAAAVFVALAAVACTSAEPDDAATLEPPTTFEGQPDSLTTVPDEVVPTTLAPTTTITIPPPSGVTAADLCAGAQLIEPAPEIDTELLPETSGVGYSRTSADRMYAHNDSGNLPRLFGIDETSAVDFVWTVDAALFDWEDLAVAGAHVYLADIGDNLHIRPTVRVLKIAEPDGADATLPVLQTWTFTYEETRFDAETLLVEPDESAGVVVTKGLDAPATIFELDLQDERDDPRILEPVGTLSLGLITAGDVSADGRVVGLRTLDRILLFDRTTDQSIAEALAGTPCDAPAADERQGEAFAFHPDGRGYTTLSERESATRNDFRLPDAS